MARRPSISPTGSPALRRAIIKTRRRAGFNGDWCQQMRVPEHTREFVVNAVHGQTRESWTVHGTNEQAAWIELARQCGIELED